MDAAKKTVRLVLSSGSARGLAHIGVIEELEQRGYEIVAVSGSSIGAAVGGIYAAGKLPAYKDWALQLSRMDVFNLFDFTFSSHGFLKGERVFEEMHKIIGDSRIEEGRIPFTAVATDVAHNKEIWLQEGSLFEAIRASVSIPTVITPIYSEKHILIDGGVINPVPVEPVLPYQSDLLMVVNCNANIPYHSAITKTPEEQKDESKYLSRLEVFRKKWSKYLPKSDTPANPKTKAEKQKAQAQEKMGYMSLMNKTLELMGDKLIALTINSHQPDVIVNVSRGVCSMFEFYKAHEIIEAGRQAAIKSLNEFEDD